MNKFMYAFAFNLTALQYANGDMMNYLGISDAQRKMLLADMQTLEEAPLQNNIAAQFVSDFEKAHDNKLTRLDKKTQYDSRVTQNSSMDDNIILAAHEQRHQMAMGNSPSNINKLPLALGGAAAAAAFMYDGVGMNLAIAPTAGVAVGFAYKNNSHYAEELTCYRYQERMKHLLNIHPGQNITDVKFEKSVLNKNFSFAQQLKERFIDGYPTPDKRMIIELEEKEWAIEHEAPVFTPRQLSDIHSETRNRLTSHHFKLHMI